MTNWNPENSKCLRDCKKNLDIDNNLLADKIKPFEEDLIEHVENEKESGKIIENMPRGTFLIRNIKNNDYRRGIYGTNVSPFLFRNRLLLREDPILIRDNPIIVRESLIKKDPEIHFGIDKLVVVLIILILLIVGGVFLLKKH